MSTSPVSDNRSSKPGRRMICKDISRSKSFAQMSTEAQLLFCLLLPHFSSRGKMNGSPHTVKGVVCPLIETFTILVIERCLAEISQGTGVKWFESNGLMYIHALNFSKYQDLRLDRLGRDEFPDYSGTTPGKFQESSRTTPGVVQPEVEVEGEGEEIPIAPKSGASASQDAPKPKPTPKNTPAQENLRAVVRGFKAKMGVPLDDASWDRVYFKRFSAPAKAMLTLFNQDLEMVGDCIDALGDAFKRKGLNWTPETIVKHAGDWKHTGKVFQ